MMVTESLEQRFKKIKNFGKPKVINIQRSHKEASYRDRYRAIEQEIISMRIDDTEKWELA